VEYFGPVTVVEYEFIGLVLMGTAVAFFLIALPVYALIRHLFPEKGWHLGGGVSVSGIELTDLVVAGGFMILYGVSWKLLPETVAKQDVNEMTATAIISGSIAVLMIAMVVPLVLFWRVNLLEFFGLRWEGWRKVLWIAPCFVVSMLALGFLMQVLGWQDWVNGHFGAKEQKMVQLMKETPDVGILIAIAFGAVVIAPVAEEVIFRGYLYPVAKRYSDGWFAALFTGVLFGVIHFNVMGLPLLAVMGVVLVVLYERTGSLWVSIACHGLFNAVQVINMLVMRFSENS